MRALDGILCVSASNARMSTSEAVESEDDYFTGGFPAGLRTMVLNQEERGTELPLCKRDSTFLLFEEGRLFSFPQILSTASGPPVDVDTDIERCRHVPPKLWNV